MKAASKTKLVYVSGTSSSIKDELLELNGAHSIEDAVQIDAEDLMDAIESQQLSQQTATDLAVIVSNESAGVFQFY